MNTQAIEKKDKRTDGLLAVNSIFHTIQGEGPFCGTPAVFVRLAGCNLRCPGCDTEYTERLDMTVTELVEAVYDAIPEWTSKPYGPFDRKAPTRLVVITGGEPFRQDIRQLIILLTDANYYVQIESNGTLPPPSNDMYLNSVPWSFDTDIRFGAYIVCSPKTGKVHPEIARIACAYKYVIEAGSLNREDGLPLLALQHSAAPHVARPPKNFARPVYLQPMDSKNEAKNAHNLEVAVDSCLRFGYILQLQVHKLIGVD